MSRLVPAMLGATLVAFGVWTALEPVGATDLYWLMAAGRWIVGHREIPQIDVFSYTYAGAPWTNQEWLTQILFWELFEHGGGTAVALFRIVTTTAIVCLAAWLGVRRGAAPVAAAATACAAAVVSRPNLDIRPHLFQFLGTLLLIGLVDACRRGGGLRPLVLLPLLVVVWVNAHFKPTGIPTDTTATVRFTDVSFVLNGISYPMPDGVVNFDVNAPATSTTVFSGTPGTS